MVAADSMKSPTLDQQLWHNQIWETVGFVAKAASLFLLTPLMLTQWGGAGYGEFAVASSAVIFLTMFDLGMKGRIRVEICRAVADDPAASVGSIMSRCIARFAVIGVLIFTLVALPAAAGLWSEWLGLPPGSDRLILVTTACTELFMLTSFLLEPLVACGHIGLTKMAGAAGSVVAIPAVWLVLWSGGGATEAVAAWLGSLAFFNILTPLATGHLRDLFRWNWSTACHGGWRETLFAGAWFNVSNAAWLLKNHGLTFIISAVTGPAAAGVFYIILRLSETIGAFGAVASDVTLGSLSSGDVRQKRQVFSSAYRFAIAICLSLAIGIGILAPVFWQVWLKTEAPLGWATGWLAALLGLASGLNRIIIHSAMALGIVRTAAIWSAAGAVITLCGVLPVERFFGLGGTLIWTSLGLLILYPVSLQIAQFLAQPFWQTWKPVFFPKTNSLNSSLT